MVKIKENNPLCCENYIYATRNARRLLCAFILVFTGQFKLEESSWVSPVRSLLQTGLSLKVCQGSVFCNPLWYLNTHEILMSMLPGYCEL